MPLQAYQNCQGWASVNLSIILAMHLDVFDKVPMLWTDREVEKEQNLLQRRLQYKLIYSFDIRITA